MGKIRIIILIIVAVLILGVAGFLIYAHFHKEEPDPKLEPSGTMVNGENLNWYAVDAYNNTLKQMFPDRQGASEKL